MKTLLLDRDLPLTRFNGRLWPVFCHRVGILSPLERLRLGDASGSGASRELVYFHPDPTVERLAARVIGAAPLRAGIPEEVAFAYLEGRSDELTSRLRRSRGLDAARGEPAARGRR